MVQTTQMLTVTSVWQNVPLNGADNISITLESPYQPVKLRVANSAPAAEVKDGNTIDAVRPTCVITDLAAGQGIWVRTVGGDSTIAYQ